MNKVIATAELHITIQLKHQQKEQVINITGLWLPT